MAELNKGALTSENNNSFPNNNTGFITPDLLRTFNGNMIDSMVDEISYNVDSASFNSRINAATGSGGSVSTGSLLLTASAVNNVITFTKGDGSTFPITVDTGSGGSVPAGTVSSSAQIAEFGYATTGSNTFNGNQTINGNGNITGSLTASGLNYPTADNGEKSFIQTDGNGNLSLQYVDTIFETFYAVESVSKGTPLYFSGSQGANPRAFAADASDPTKMPVVVVANDNLTAGNTYEGIVLGLIEGLDLTGFTAGQSVYVAEGGGYSTSLPSGSNSITQLLGVITKGGAGGKGLVLNPGPAQLPGLQTGYVWVGNTSNQPVAIATSSLVTSVDTGSLLLTASATDNVITFTKGDGSTFPITVATGSGGGAGDRNGLITTGSSVTTQALTGSLIVSGATFNGKIEAPSLSIGVTNLDTLFESTASGVPSQIDFTRLGAGPTGDLSGIRLQTLSGSDTSGDTLLSRVSTGVNRHTSTAMTGSTVNTIVQSQWATGSAGGRVSYNATITATAQSASATVALTAGNGAQNFTQGTASISAGFIRIGAATAHRVEVTGSARILGNTNITGSLNVSSSLSGDAGNFVNGTLTLVAPLNTPAISIKSGSFELTTPQGSGSFYSNCPITSSGLRINGTALVADLIVSGVFGGNSSLQVTANASVTQSLYVGGQLDVNSIGGARGLSITGSNPTITNGSLSGSLIGNLGSIYTASIAPKNLVTLGSASMATLLSGAGTDANTIYFVI